MLEFWIWERFIFKLVWFNLVWFWFCVFCNYWVWWILLFWLYWHPSIKHINHQTDITFDCFFFFFFRMVDQQKLLSFISSHDHCQRFSPLQISDTSQPLRAALVKCQMSAGSISIKNEDYNKMVWYYWKLCPPLTLVLCVLRLLVVVNFVILTLLAVQHPVYQPPNWAA